MTEWVSPMNVVPLGSRSYKTDDIAPVLSFSTSRISLIVKHIDMRIWQKASGVGSLVGHSFDAKSTGDHRALERDARHGSVFDAGHGA